MARLGDNRYGKSRVRLSRITRRARPSRLQRVDGGGAAARRFRDQLHRSGQQQNSAHRHDEEHRLLHRARIQGGDHRRVRDGVGRLPAEQQSPGLKVSVEIAEKYWERLVVNGPADATTFKLGGPEMQTVLAARAKGGTWSVTSGIDGLTILKTTKSAFTGYIKDKLTTLKPATDRIFGTRATVTWDYSSPTPRLRRGPRENHRSAAEGVRCAPQHERAAHTLRHGQSRPCCGSGDCAHHARDAESASSAGRPQPVRPGQSQPHLRSHRRAAWVDRGHDRAIMLSQMRKIRRQVDVDFPAFKRNSISGQGGLASNARAPLSPCRAMQLGKDTARKNSRDAVDSRISRRDNHALALLRESQQQRAKMLR